MMIVSIFFCVISRMEGKAPKIVLFFILPKKTKKNAIKVIQKYEGGSMFFLYNNKKDKIQRTPSLKKELGREEK